MTRNEMDVLIVGAGASGLTLACDLRRRGINCRVVEKRREPFPGSRGKGLQPRTLEAFDDLGVLEAITRAGGPFPIFRGHSGTEQLWERDLATVMGLARLESNSSAPYSMWMIPQYATEQILRARLAELGGAIELGTEITACAQTEDGVMVKMTSDRGVEEARFKYVVGADGGKSFIRQHLAIGFAGETGSYRSVIADVEVEGVERGRWHIWLCGETSLDRVTLCALPGTSLFQFSAPVKEADTPEISIPYLRDLFAERSKGFPLQWKKLHWSTLYRLNVRMAERFRVGRVFLVGDAAHVHSPFGGQGINTSIQDAYNLGWKLAAALRGHAAVLDTYEQERLPVAADVLGLSSGMHRENYDRLTTEALTEGNKDIYQLRISYRGGPLASEQRRVPGKVQAGDRAPDAPCALGSGMPLRLFDLFRGPHWTVLCFGRNGAAVANALTNERVHAFHVSTQIQDDAGRSVFDGAEHIHRAYELEPHNDATLVIRPDGYVGMATDSDGLNRARAYLASVGE